MNTKENKTENDVKDEGQMQQDGAEVDELAQY
jgi:hypothetical protein